MKREDGRGKTEEAVRRDGDLGRSRGKAFEGGDLADLGNILGFAEAGNGLGREPEERDEEEVENREGGGDEHVALFAGLLGRVGHGHGHGRNLKPVR